MKPFKRFVILYIVIPLGVFVFKLIGATCRLKEMNAEKMTSLQGKEKQYIYAFKHSQLLEMIYFYRNTKTHPKPCVLMPKKLNDYYYGVSMFHKLIFQVCVALI